MTFDFTAKVEHILERAGMFPELNRLGCVFMVSAVESLSDTVLANLEKGHTRADVARALQIVRAAGIEDLLEARIDGVVAKREKLRGKPHPDTFCRAAEELGVDLAQAAVFEDALAGVEAGRTGHFGYVVGVDRTGQADALREHGADVVVTDLTGLLE